MPNVSNFSSTSQYLVNTRTDIDSVSKGQQGGSILSNSSTWSPSEVSTDTENAPSHLPDLGTESKGPVYSTETDLQGTWQGVRPTSADFEASQLNFGANQKTDSQGSLEFRQKISMGLKKGSSDTPAPLISGVRRLSEKPSYTQTDVSVQLGMTKRDAEGNELFAIDHTQRFLENGDQATETAGTYHASPDLQLNGSYATEKDSQTTTLGFNYSHTEKLPDPPEGQATATTENPSKTEGEQASPPDPKTFSVSGEIQQNQTLEAHKQSLSAGVSYGDTSINYGQERIDPTQLTEGFALPQTQQNISANTKLGKDLSVGVSQKQTVASFLDCDSNGNSIVGRNTTTSTDANLDYEISKATTLGYVHSREVLTSSSQSGVVNSTESNQVNLKHTFNTYLSGALSYTNKVNNAELYSAKLTITDPASPEPTTDTAVDPNTGAETPAPQADLPYSSVSSKWEFQIDQERSKIDPRLNNRNYTVSYSTQRPDDGVAMDCKYSRYIPQGGQAKWDSSIRLYGDGTQAIPLVAELKLSSDQASPSFNLSASWNF